MRDYFATAASILLSPETPCGCMVVLGTMSTGKQADIMAAITAMRESTKKLFEQRLRRAIEDGQIPAESDVQAVASALNTFLEGLTIQARSGITLGELKTIAAYALHLLPKKIDS